MKDNRKLKRRVRNSYAISTVSIALVIFLLGSVGYLLSVAVNSSRALQNRAMLTVELARTAEPEQRESIERQLSAKEYITSVEFSSKESKAEDEAFREMFGEDFEKVLGENPLLDTYEVLLDGAVVEAEQIDELVSELRKMKGVNDVIVPLGVVEKINSTISRIRTVLWVFGGVLLLISLILLNNTIRISIYSKRYIINTQKLVGATKWFIMRPFLASALWQGVLAGVVAAALFALVCWRLGEAMPEFGTLTAPSTAAVIMAAMVVGGVVISLLFTTFAVNKFVNMKTNKIHLY
ncbi:MAG: permease-like cell division protein FtsX [Rikenellaceae bacterium]|nr:permease-like cell division protein FtsX [Rikenellaceae bacterium]MBR2419381.1 permease-like cell division protein FtsX [Rikenellaceae bacterium]MBR3801609.1 permease-like cell division protein FtsX [Rikenellaceae bacterium]